MAKNVSGVDAEPKGENEKIDSVAADVGRVSYDALKKASEMVKPGKKLLDVAQYTEDVIREQGFELAFPLNISVNEQAAHYTPSLGDEKVFAPNDIVKLDIGAAKDGILGDCAMTIDLSGKNGALLDASKRALDDAISTVKAGVRVSDIGKAIQNAIESKGFKPIRNLGGHGVMEHNLHAELFIPNFDNGDDTELEEGMIVAIEPFATTGRGMVSDGDSYEIYDYIGSPVVRSQNARSLLTEIEKSYHHEPFAVRWLSNVVSSKFGLYSGVRELFSAGAINAYPVLVELGNGMVSQFEAEVLVEKDGCKVLTR
jgi:methionyl aminopeptidase